jgi:hypothetical protein
MPQQVSLDRRDSTPATSRTCTNPAGGRSSANGCGSGCGGGEQCGDGEDRHRCSLRGASQKRASRDEADEANAANNTRYGNAPNPYSVSAIAARPRP